MKTILKTKQMDAVTLGRIEHLHPKLRDEVRKIYIEEIVPALSGRATCRLTSTLRTFEEQNELYAKGRTVLYNSFGNRIGKVTNAKGGQSYHNYGLALDICLIVDKRYASWDYKKDFDGDKVSDWMEVVKIFKAHGWDWGGDWKFIDRPHFQKTFGLSTKELLRRYNAKDFIPGTDYVRL